MREKTYKTALGGVLSALAVVFMLLGSILPFATYLGPLLSSCCVLLFCCEFGCTPALIMYAASALLSLLICPDIEQSFIYAGFLGWYPVFKLFLEKRVKNRALQTAIKLLAANAAVVAVYMLLLRVLKSPALTNEFEGYGSGMLAIIMLLFNVTFLVCDIALTRLAAVYFLRIRKRLLGK